jgi:tetratricopeptide (TPR) repeat protein
MPRWAKATVILACLLAVGGGAYWYLARGGVSPELEAAMRAASEARARWKTAPQDATSRYALVEADLKVVEGAFSFDGQPTGHLSRPGRRHLGEVKDVLDKTDPSQRGLTYMRLMAYYYAAVGRTREGSPSDLETAATMCEQALRKYPPTSGNKKELASVARLFGLTRLLQHRDSDAAEGLRKAVAWYPQDADTHFRYGVTLARLVVEAGGPLMRQAISEYQKSLAIDPNQGRVWYYLGFADMRLGDKQSAITAFQKAKALGYEEAKEALTKLGAG